MESALESAARSLQAAGATQIHRVKIRIGRLSGVEPVALRYAFESLKSTASAAEAELEIEEVPAACWCPVCQAEFEMPDPLVSYECPRCHELSGDLRRGQELELASLEIS